MDKKDWTPDEIKIRDSFEKIYQQDTRTPSGPLDMSFLENPAAKQPQKNKIRFLRIAAIIAIICISSFTTAIVISNDYVTAIPNSLERKLFEMKNGVTVTSDLDYIDEGETVWKISELELAQAAKQIIPDLLIPTYIPDEYKFDELTLHRFGSETHLANYTFRSSSDLIIINCQSSDEEFDSAIYNNQQIIELSDRIIVISDDPITSTKGATIITDSSHINITPSDYYLTTEQLISIGKGLK